MCKNLQLVGDIVPQTAYRGFAPGPHCGTSVPWTSWLASVYSRPVWGNSPPKNQKSPNKKNRRDRRTRGTNSWLNDTDKNFGPDLPLLFKLHEMCIDPHQTGFVGKDSDHPQLVKFWPSHAPGKGSAAERKFLAPPYYSQRAVFASLWALFH